MKVFSDATEEGVKYIVTPNYCIPPCAKEESVIIVVDNDENISQYYGAIHSCDLAKYSNITIICISFILFVTQ